MRLKMVLDVGVGIYTIDEICVLEDSGEIEMEVRQNKQRIVMDSKKKTLLWYDEWDDVKKLQKGVVAYIEIGNKKYKFKDFSEEELQNFITGEREE